MKKNRSSSTNRSISAAVGYILVGAGIILLLLAGAFGLMRTGIVEQPEWVDHFAGIQFEEDQTKTPAESGGIIIPGFEVWNVPAGKTQVDSRFYNPAKNNCYFVVTVTLDDTGETVYESKYIKPGQSLYEVELLRPLSAGIYPATLHYSTYSMTDNSPMNGADVPFVIAVE